MPEIEPAPMELYWKHEAAKLQEIVNNQNKVLADIAKQTEQAALAIRALNNKCIRLQNENARLVGGLRTAAIINNTAKHNHRIGA